MHHQADFIVESYAQPQRHLRIALVTETYPPEINGVAMTIGRIVYGLLQRGHAVQLIRPRQAEDGQPSMSRQFEEIFATGVPIPHYRGLKFGLPAKSRLVALWRHKRPDIVHVVTEGPLGWSAIAAARKLKLPVTSSFHTNFHTYTRHYGISWLRKPIEGYLRKLHNHTHATLVPTRSLANELGRLGYRNLEVLSRGVDTRLFNPARRSQTLRAGWGASENTLVVLYIGRLAAEKNVGLVVSAFSAIQAHLPSAKLLFVGDGPLRVDLEAACPGAIFAGMRTGEDLAAHYASADLFLFPSLTETFGNVTTEALASGLGVIGYDYAAAAEVIRNDVNGLTVVLNDEAAFIEAAISLAVHPARLSRLRQNASSSVSHLDWEQIHDSFSDILNSVVARHDLEPKTGVSVVLPAT